MARMRDASKQDSPRPVFSHGRYRLGSSPADARTWGLIVALRVDAIDPVARGTVGRTGPVRINGLPIPDCENGMRIAPDHFRLW